MTDQKPAAGHLSSAESSESDKMGDEEPPNAAKGATDNDGNKHVVRILGTYNLFTFFKQEAQEKFFETITSRAFERIFDPDLDPTYAKEAGPFLFSREETQLELRMTNMGFIREGFWKEAFPPIFELDLGKTDLYGPAPNWMAMLPSSTEGGLLELLPSSSADFRNGLAEAYFYAYSLRKLGAELEKVRHELGLDTEVKFHIGLNKFGIVNIGLTIKWKHDETIRFEDLCRSAYTAVSHLQEDPLEDLKGEAKALTAGDQRTLLEKVSDDLETGDRPRLVVSYFQVLAITTIHRFLYEKLDRNAIGGFENESLANPWELSNEIEESTRNGLPPLRHVVFMYQLVQLFSDKATFLDNNRRALLTLGHNVGWSPSLNPPFPLFDSRRAKLNDSSLLETSCCLIFPQGLVVVIPPEPSGEAQKVCPGGTGDNKSSLKVPYRDYWKLIFKLFIRVAEARLLIGMVNRHLSDLHKDFLRCRRTGFSWRTWKEFSKIHSQLIEVGLIIQRTSGRVITPEVTRYSFVRRKLIDFLKTVNFEEHRGYIQSEFEKLNQWVEAARTTWIARVAIVVAALSLFATAVIGGIQIYLSVKQSPDCPSQKAPEWVKGLSGQMDNLKKSTANVNSEMEKFQVQIGSLAEDLETLKRCQHHNPKHTTSEKRPPSSAIR